MKSESVGNNVPLFVTQTTIFGNTLSSIIIDIKMPHILFGLSLIYKFIRLTINTLITTTGEDEVAAAAAPKQPWTEEEDDGVRKAINYIELNATNSITATMHFNLQVMTKTMVVTNVHQLQPPSLPRRPPPQSLVSLWLDTIIIIASRFCLCCWGNAIDLQTEPTCVL